MFSGIIEDIGFVKSIHKQKENIILEIKSKISSQLIPDQSVSHNGVCLTITNSNSKTHKVTAVKETLDKSNLGNLKIGDLINLERSLIINQSINGHFVQGHVDQTCKLLKIKDEQGSVSLSIELKNNHELIVEKGSICINGVSLTVSKLKTNSFHVVIIPYTMKHTTLKLLKPGDFVNIEFDILGKYVYRILSLKQKRLPKI